MRSVIVAISLAATVTLAAQGRSGVGNSFARSADEWCAESNRHGGNDRVACDVREESLTDLTALDVDTGGNGGIVVRGVSGSTAHLRVRVVAHARSESAARTLTSAIEISTDNGRVRARGPRSRDSEGWSVDVEIETPRGLPLMLVTANGGISIEDTTGRTRFETSNGGVSLTDVAGDVQGSTVNGGVTVRLDGQRWEGEGLDVATTNGGVRMSLPDSYNAELTAETTNGGLHIDFPVTVQGRLSDLNHRIVTTIGAGGPRLRLRTVNGGVQITRR